MLIVTHWTTEISSPLVLIATLQECPIWGTDFLAPSALERKNCMLGSVGSSNVSVIWSREVGVSYIVGVCNSKLGVC